MPATPKPKPPPKPSGIASVDALADLSPISLADYIEASSDYIDQASMITDAQSKRAQIRLSNGLARIVLAELRSRVGPMPDAVAGETKVGGGLRESRSDVTDFHIVDGVRLAIELKPVHLAVGRAIWNRFGDVRVFAVNIHLKFPFAVVAGILTIPVSERRTSNDDSVWKSTEHLIDKAIARLKKAATRDLESDPDHLFEGASVIVFDHRTRALDPIRPPIGSGLRFDECMDRLADAYKLRFS